MTRELVHVAKRFREELDQVDELVHTLLKGHLLIEEVLSSILEKLAFHPQHLTEARLTFKQKVVLCRSLCLDQDQCGTWELILAINSLRNELAHRLKSKERDKRLQKLKERYLKEVAGSEIVQLINSQADHLMVLNACAQCAGFLAQLESESVAYRAR